jgi:hypothetical protein
MGRKPGETGRGFRYPVPQSSCVVELAEAQTGATERVVAPALIARDAAGRLTLEELFTLPEPVQASLTSPHCASIQAEAATAEGSKETTFSPRSTAIPCSVRERAFAQLPSRRRTRPAAR